MSKLTCDVIFFKNFKYDYTGCMNVPVGEALGEYFTNESAETGRLSNVTVEIKDDTTLEEIESLKAEKKNIGAEAQVKINNLDGKIQSLLAIECDS